MYINIKIVSIITHAKKCDEGKDGSVPSVTLMEDCENKRQVMAVSREKQDNLSGVLRQHGVCFEQ